MLKRKTIKRALRPSERESITDFSDSFSSGRDYELKMKRRRIISVIIAVLVTVLLISLGFFITETLIDISELPV